MKVKVKLAQPCRAYDLVLDREAYDRHSDLMIAFIRRDILSPRGGSGGPLIKDMKVVPGKFRLVFFLAEEVCDEYEKSMGMRK